MDKPGITIAIPCYNSDKTVAESIESALSQKYAKKEILVLDDGSTDRTAEILAGFKGIRVITNEYNCGIGPALTRLMREASGRRVLYLCSDDQFTDPYVTGDYVRAFESNKKLGVVGRYYYQYMNGHPGPIMVCRDKNILTSSCNPSGMAFKKMFDVKASGKIFIECPSLVREYLVRGWEWSMLEYDTIRARIHPGGNTGTKESYYRGSMYQNWFDLLGEPIDFPQGYIQLKNRSPRTLWSEICLSVKLRPSNLTSPLFWFNAIVAVIVPGFLLRPLANFYRHRVTRRFVKTIERPN